MLSGSNSVYVIQVESNVVISVLNGCEILTRYVRASRLVFFIPISASSVFPLNKFIHMHLNNHTPTHPPTHLHTGTSVSTALIIGASVGGAIAVVLVVIILVVICCILKNRAFGERAVNFKINSIHSPINI